METRKEDIAKIVAQYGMQYAKGVILDRAIPSIDGFKPSQRRVLYTMKEMGLTRGKKAKCIRISGQTMTYHPHGEGSAYMTMVLMTDRNETYNVPYVTGKGSFGKVYSRDIECAKPRYPEAGLAPISQELFAGLNNGAVKMVPNFDNTAMEPELLPVKFPTIITNPIAGIAVGKSCNIPCFPLNKVCAATSGIIAGKITTAEELAIMLDCPEYTTGGFIHSSNELMAQLCETGRASFTISGCADVYSDKIEIYEIPFTTTAEEIIDNIRDLVNDGTLKEISNVHNGISIDGYKIKVFVKRGYDSRKVLEKLYRYTKLRDRISYKVMVIRNNECVDNIGILELLKMWIEFRHECIVNETKYILEETNKEMHKLETWEIVKDHINEIGEQIPKNKQQEMAEILRSTYGLDDIQSKYLLDMPSRKITIDNMLANLEELNNKRVEVIALKEKIGDRSIRDKQIISELMEISQKYGSEPKTKLTEIIDDKQDIFKEQISDQPVTIKVTKNGYVKRLISLNDMMRFECPIGDKVLRTITLKNNEYLLVFTCDGEMYKVLADDIDASRGGLKEKLAEKLHLESVSKVLWVDAAGDYSGYFNLIYPNGKGERVYYSKAAGKRSKYISMFPPVTPGNCWITQEDKFFIITRKRNAAYIDITDLGMFSTRKVFRVAMIKSGDAIFGVQPLSQVPNKEKINLDRYNKKYTVSIGSDVLWDENVMRRIAEENERIRKQKEELAKQQYEKEKSRAIDAMLASMESDDDDDYYED